MPPFPGDAGTPCVPCSVPGAPWGLCCCRAHAQQGCAASCPQSCGFPLPPAPCPGAEQRCLCPHAHPASLSCSVASSFWGCHRLEAGLRAAPRGTATEGLRALRVAGPAPFISLTHCPWIATCQCICMYIAVHTGESANINVQEAPLPAVAALLGLRLPVCCFRQALCWWWLCQSPV